MLRHLVILFGLGLTAAGLARDKRQTASEDPFHNVPDICNPVPMQGYVPHPFDNTKYLQCDVYGRMFIVQCPLGTVFVAATSNCQNLIPSTTVLPTVQVTLAQNPCTPEAAALGQLYFPVTSNNSSFIECDLIGTPTIIACPYGLVWYQSILACVYPSDVVQGESAGQITTPNPREFGVGGNPCVTVNGLSPSRMFFPHPDPHKFIQCDLWGDTFVVSCPSNLVWNAALETCYSPYLSSRK